MRRKQAVSAPNKPKQLPKVEPELRAPVPRDIRPLERNGSALHADLARRIREWRAVKGWIVSVDKVDDYEGPDFKIVIAWDQPQLRIEKFVVGYDSYHWAVSYPEHFAWFHRRIKPREPVTVLVSPRGKDWCLYGQCEPFVRRDDKLVFAAE